jgi:hypothetical protein
MSAWRKVSLRASPREVPESALKPTFRLRGRSSPRRQKQTPEQALRLLRGQLPKAVLAAQRPGRRRTVFSCRPRRLRLCGRVPLAYGGGRDVARDTKTQRPSCFLKTSASKRPKDRTDLAVRDPAPRRPQNPTPQPVIPPKPAIFTLLAFKPMARLDLSLPHSGCNRQILGFSAIPSYTFAHGNPEWPTDRGDGAGRCAWNLTGEIERPIFLI